MLLGLFGGLTLPGAITDAPEPGELVSLEFGGTLRFSVGASAGYEIKGTQSISVRDLALSEHYAMSVIGKLTLSGGVSGRFSVDVTAGSEPGFARVVVRRRRQQELQVAADVKVQASLTTEGLPSSGKEFLGALLGVQGKNWLNLADRLVSEAGEVDSVEELKAKLDGLAMHYVSAFAGKAIDKLTRIDEVKAFQGRLAKVVHSYRTLDKQAIALFDRYFDPVLDRSGELLARLTELQALTSWDRLKGEVDPLLWNVVRQLTGGDPLSWALGRIPGTPIPSLPELKKRVADTVALLQDEAHKEIREFVRIAKAEFGLDPLFNQLAAISTPQGLKAIANEKLGGFVQRLVGDAVDQLNGNALKKAFQVVRDVVGARDRFFKEFDQVLEEAASQRFTLGLHAAYRTASEADALVDMEIRLREPDGRPCAPGLRLMEAAGRGDFVEALASYQPAVVRLQHGLLTHTVTSQTTMGFNVAGWHRAFSYQGMHRVIVATRQQIRDSGQGVLTVFTNVDLQADSEKRRRGSRGEEVVQTNFLLRLLAESRLADSTFDAATRQYALEVVTGMAASYRVTFTDDDTSPAELDDYLLFARQLGLDAAGATRGALDPLLELKEGSLGKTSSHYDVRFTEAGVRTLMGLRARPEDIRGVLRRQVLAAYFNHPVLHDVGWLYASDDVRALFDEHGPAFAGTESVLRNAEVRLTSPIAGVLPPARFANTAIIRHDVATLFRIEDAMIRAFEALTALLSSPGAIRTADLESKLEAFGDVLQQFDKFDLAENSIFAVFDGLLQASGAAGARLSSLTFTSFSEGAERTKVFVLTPLAPAATEGRQRGLAGAPAAARATGRGRRGVKRSANRGSDRGQTGVRRGSDRGQTRVRPGSGPRLTPKRPPKRPTRRSGK